MSNDDRTEITVYRGASGEFGQPVLESVTWAPVGDDHPNGVALPKKLGLKGKWLFVSGSMILSALPHAEGKFDMFGKVLAAGGPVFPINPYAAPAQKHNKMLTLDEYVILHNTWAEDDVMLRPITDDSEPILYVNPGA